MQGWEKMVTEYTECILSIPSTLSSISILSLLQIVLQQDSISQLLALAAHLTHGPPGIPWSPFLAPVQVPSLQSRNPGEIQLNTVDGSEILHHLGCIKPVNNGISTTNRNW